MECPGISAWLNKPAATRVNIVTHLPVRDTNHRPGPNNAYIAAALSLERVNSPGRPAAGDAYITLHGRSTWALVNAYHAAVRERGLRPERVVIVTEEPYAEAASITEAAVGMVRRYGSPEWVEVLPEADFVGAGQMIRSLAGGFIQQGMTLR